MILVVTVVLAGTSFAEADHKEGTDLSSTLGRQSAPKASGIGNLANTADPCSPIREARENLEKQNREGGVTNPEPTLPKTPAETEQIEKGKALFEAKCLKCHANESKKYDDGRIVKLKESATLVSRLASGDMPKKDPIKLTPDEQAQVIAYLKR